MRPGHVIALCVLVLLTFGVVMVTSAQMSVAPVDPLSPTSAPPADGSVADLARSVLVTRTTAYMLLALGTMLVVSQLPVRRAALAAERAALAAHDRGWLFVLGMALLLMLAIVSLPYWPGLSRAINGSRRWIEIGLPGVGRLSLQPSEAVKWAMPALVAWYAVARGERMPSLVGGMAPGLLAAGLIAGAIAVEDLGTGALIGLAACVVLLAGGARLAHMLLMLPAGLAALVLLIVASPYRINRIISFIDPYLDPQDRGYHMIQSMVAVAGGGVTGRGLGHGLQKFGYLREDTTDFLFAIICEELGVAGAALVILAFVALIWACFLVMRREPSLFLKLVALGVVCTVGMQAMINLLVVTGLGPTKGIALPLVSSGGTGWILTAGALGALIAMDRTRPLDDEEPADDPTEPEPADPALGRFAAARA